MALDEPPFMRAHMVLANHPIPAGVEQFYFEIEIKADIGRDADLPNALASLHSQHDSTRCQDGTMYLHQAGHTTAMTDVSFPIAAPQSTQPHTAKEPS